MPNRTTLTIITLIILCLMLFFNKKVRVFNVLIKQLQVFKNAKTNKVSIWDIVCFIILPIILSIIISVGYRVKSKKGISFRKWAKTVLKEYIL